MGTNRNLMRVKILFDTDFGFHSPLYFSEYKNRKYKTLLYACVSLGTPKVVCLVCPSKITWKYIV